MVSSSTNIALAAATTDEWFLLGFYATVGCHPTRSAEFDKFKGGPEAYLNALDDILRDNIKGNGRAVAVGECGLGDYGILVARYLHWLSLM